MVNSESVLRVAFPRMLASDGSFYFNGKAVRSSFLKKSFHFNSNLQGSSPQNGAGCNSKTGSKQLVYGPLGLGRNRIVVYLEWLAESTSSAIPDKNEIRLMSQNPKVFTIHSLPSINTKLFNSTPPSSSYFTRNRKNDAHQGAKSAQILEMFYLRENWFGK